MASRKMVLNRNLVLPSKSGHSIAFKKGEPIHVPPVMYGEVLSIGGEFVDGEGLPAKPEHTHAAPIDPVERAEAILAAVKDVADVNDTDDFTAAGIPKQEAVTKRCGFSVTKKDVAQAWQRRHDQIAEGDAGAAD